jgi:hypothetical protein
MAAFNLGDLGREWLAIGPYRAVLEVFFLPDRHSALESIDKPAAGIEGRGTVS